MINVSKNKTTNKQTKQTKNRRSVVVSKPIHLFRLASYLFVKIITATSRRSCLTVDCDFAYLTKWPPIDLYLVLNVLYAESQSRNDCYRQQRGVAASSN